jgi:hypothetical protein
MKKAIQNWLRKQAIKFIQGDDVKWIVNDSAELGVMIGTQKFFLYKGDSLKYENGMHDNGMPMYYRQVGKREFGECCHPVHLTRHPGVYREGLNWKKFEEAL